MIGHEVRKVPVSVGLVEVAQSNCLVIRASHEGDELVGAPVERARTTRRNKLQGILAPGCRAPENNEERAHLLRCFGALLRMESAKGTCATWERHAWPIRNIHFAQPLFWDAEYHAGGLRGVVANLGEPTQPLREPTSRRHGEIIALFGSRAE